LSEDRLAVEIRAAFDNTHVSSPGLEDRVVSAIPWDRPAERRTSMPRLAGGFAAALAVLAIAILVAPTLMSKLNLQFPGTNGPEPPAYSLAAVSGGSVYVVQRGGIGAATAPANELLQSTDGGRTWVDRLHYTGIYGGTQVFGANGFTWSIDMTPSGCPPGGGSCSKPQSNALTLYGTKDGGATWSALPAPSFPVEDVFFLDPSRGWAASGSPETGLGSDVLYQTADGGKTWSRIAALPSAVPMGYVFGVGSYRVTFSRADDGSLTGWFVGATQLYTSTDNGHSWHPIVLSVPAPVAGWTSTPSQPAFSGPEGVLPIAYHDPKGPDNATANHIYLYVSHDGGATWGDPRPAPAGFAPVGDILSISILDARHIWLDSMSFTGGDNVQASPAVARTSDGGLTWTVVKNTPRILQMTFADATHGYAEDVTGTYNVNGILITSDGGATWQRVTVPLFAARKN
jgi:photosystem II stability/assembly factor-like uncharacterized protein